MRRRSRKPLDLLDLAKTQGASGPVVEMMERIRAANLESPPNAPKPDTSDLLGEALRRQIWGGPPPRPKTKKPTEPAKKAWSAKPPQKDVDAAMVEVAKEFPPAEEYLPNTPRPPFSLILERLRARCGHGVTVRQAKAALENCAPHLRGRPGYRSKRKSSV
jgi:hypothetical protein